MEKLRKPQGIHNEYLRNQNYTTHPHSLLSMAFRNHCGIFISPKGILQGANSVRMSLIILLVCAGVSFLGALCYVELGIVIPKAGGTYQYILHAYGDFAGFLVSWATVVIIRPAGAAQIAITLGTYISDYAIPGDCAPPKESIQLFSIMAVRHTRYLNTEVSFVGSTTHVLSYGTALYYGFWAYSGWDNINNVSEELKNPARNLPLSMCIAIPTVTIIYLLTNIAYFTVLSPTELLASSAVAVTFAERHGMACPTGSVYLHHGHAHGITFAAGREGHMLSILSMVNVKFHTPLPAILLQGLIVFVLIIIGDFNSIIMYGSIVQWILFMAAFAAVFILRRRYPNIPRPYKVNSLVPVLAIIASIFIILAPVISDPKLEYLYAFVLLVTGILVYVVFVRGKQQLPYTEQMTTFCQKLLFVGPSRK
ncbi:b(0,+)-type amino acid transporter 1-like [Acanthaster planci]|uniref:B(0,+)-type amino acid transporter 1-like n=1 Tax=Acanthaster planci TaxID=133434 RepID=A0A8B7ZBU7_ACAPL|nr:b(0,+)-type amino acid transporter 1-like [Acanthaster planci]